MIRGGDSVSSGTNDRRGRFLGKWLILLVMNKILAVSASAIFAFFVTSVGVSAWSCGPADGGTFTSFPTEGLCGDYGVPVKVVDKKTTLAKYTWKCVWPGYDEARCSAKRRIVSPDPPSCPFDTETGDIVVNFTRWLRSDRGLDEARNIVSQRIPAGNYQVALAGWDSYEGRQYVAQPHESFRVELWGSGSKAIAKTSPTKDLKDNVKTAFFKDVVNNELMVKKTASDVVAFHKLGYGQDNPNSIRPICARFRPIPVCGNGVKEIGEQCDDGNTAGHDGCSSQCRIETPEIRIDKRAIDGKDLQTVPMNGTARFKITVYNTGQVNLTDVVVNDSDSADCNRSAAQTKALYSGSVFAAGSEFSYECVQRNMTASDNSSATVKAKAVKTGQKVSDSDPTRVIVKGTPGIMIDKNDADNGDDFQLIYEGGMATYTITVKNTSDVALKNVVVTDSVAGSDCSLTAAQTKAKYNKTGTEYFDPGEEFSYKCKQENINQNIVTSASVVAYSVQDNEKVTDTDDTEVRVRAPGEPAPPSEPEKEPEEDRDCKGSIGNLVWNDKNDNGRQDAGEAGIPGVRVWLYHGNKIRKDVTNSRGRYKFKNLCKGTYRVTVKKEDIGDLYQVYDPDGKLDSTTKVELESDKDKHTKADFGYRAAYAPNTGPGLAIGVITAALLAAGGVYYYRRKNQSV